MIGAGTAEPGRNCKNVRRKALDPKNRDAQAKMGGRYVRECRGGRGAATSGDRSRSQAHRPNGSSRTPDQRRRLSRRVLVLSAIGWWGLANGAVAQVIELRVSHFMPPNHTFQKELLRWADELDKASGGRLKLRIYPASQLGPVQRQFDLVKSGVADIAVGLHGATPGRYPLTEVVSLPFVSPKNAINSAVTSRRLTELAPTYLADEHQGLRILWMAVTNPLMFHLAKVPIKTIQDFRGLRIRYAGQQVAKIISALASVPLAVPPGEATDALAKGIVDGATFPYEAAQSFDLSGVIRYTGIFSPTEAASIGAFGAVMLGVAGRALTTRALVSSIESAVITSSMLFMIIMGANLFSNFMVQTQLPALLANTASSLALPRMTVMVAIIVAYIIMGCFLEGIGMMLITVPVFLPLIRQYGYDPIWFSIIVVIVIEVGLIHPPVGMNLFVIQAQAPEIRITSIYRGIVPFLAAPLLMIILMFLFPQLALWLPQTLYR
jgi:TRAP-type C4-dicarboxylate transport system substrate-binding protein